MPPRICLRSTFNVVRQVLLRLCEITEIHSDQAPVNGALLPEQEGTHEAARKAQLAGVLHALLELLLLEGEDLVLRVFESVLTGYRVF